MQLQDLQLQFQVPSIQVTHKQPLYKAEHHLDSGFELHGHKLVSIVPVSDSESQQRGLQPEHCASAVAVLIVRQAHWEG